MKILKIKTSKEKNAFFSSDWHLNHQGPRGGVPLWQSRGYESVSHMTESIIKTVNECVKTEDYLFFLGDFCLDTLRSKFEEDISRINCQNIYMIWGNHNSQIKDVYKEQIKLEFNRDDIEVYPLKYRNITFCGDYLELIVDGQYICMSHFPMDVFHKGLNGSYMICGHSHYNYEKTRAEYQYNKRLDVSWDGYKKPLSIKEINDIMRKKTFLSVDHHGKGE